MNLASYIKNDIIEILKYFLRSPIGYFGMYIRQFFYSRLLLSNNKIFYISKNVSINGFKNISIDEKSSIMMNSSLYALNGKILIGKNVSMNQNVTLSSENGEIVIGNKVLIGPNTVIRSSDHNFKKKELAISDQGHEFGKITIKDNVWIGANCSILKNIEIGEGSIIGAGSVVTKNVDSYSIVGGVPAKLIRKR